MPNDRETTSTVRVHVELDRISSKYAEQMTGRAIKAQIKRESRILDNISPKTTKSCALATAD